MRPSNIVLVPSEPFLALHSWRDTATICAVTGRSVTRWRQDGQMPLHHAQRLCEAAGRTVEDVCPAWNAGFDDLPHRTFDPTPLKERYGSLASVAADLRRDTHLGTVWAAGVPMDVADKAAVRLGLHPIELWPDWVADLEEVDV